jgi:hypothetical protein
VISPRTLNRVRAGVGIARLVYPHLLFPTQVTGRLSNRGREVLRVLGARQVAQALVTGRAPTAAVLWLGAEVDVAHATSMVALAAIDRRYRRPALVDAAVATAFALAGAAAAGRAPSEPAPTSRLTAWRDRCAEQVARRCVPGYRSGPTPPRS